jgi:hypothetical protein
MVDYMLQGVVDLAESGDYRTLCTFDYPAHIGKGGWDR